MAVPEKGESLYIYGMHDRGGEHLLQVNGEARGWVLVTEEIRANPGDMGGSNYTDLADKGYGVIVRLNHAYGSDGTIPLPDKYRDFAQRAANFVSRSPGAHIWIIGNEMNLEREQPRKPGSSQAEPITPRLYADCYRACRDAIRQVSGHQNDQVIVGAIGPWNGQTPYEADPQGQYPVNKIPGGPNEYPYFGFFGDYILYLRDILLAIGSNNCDGIAVHAYSHGPDPNLVFNDGKMGAPFAKYFYHFRTYKDQMNAIPAAFRHLPVYLTEMNGDDTWPDANTGWVKNAYKEINDWNKTGSQQIRCAVLYRWPKHDKWNIDGKPGVHADIGDAVANNFQWNPAAASAGAADTAQPVQPTTPTPTAPKYRTRYFNHNTPTTVAPGQTLIVSLTVQNVGSDTWQQGGANPYRLGFQWYNAAGQMVAFPSQFDYRTALPFNVPPGGSVTLQAQLRTPDVPGTYQLRWDMIHELITWFTTQGDQGLLVPPIAVSTQPVPTPTPAPTPTPTPQLPIQDVSASLPRSTTQSYPTRSTSVIRRLIIHHTATPATVTVQRIAQFQVNDRNLPGITYHFCVSSQGQIFQTQPLTVVSNHAGNYSQECVGVALIGDFTTTSPSSAQLEATAQVLAQLTMQLGLKSTDIYGYSELVKTASPGATWPTWKPPLISRVDSFIAGGVPVVTPTPTPIPTPTPTPTPAPAKTIEYYMLFWHQGPANWAKWDLMGAMTYIARFPVAIGFSVEEAKSAKYVTIVGGTGGVSASAESTLQAAGCKVERIAGATETETRQMLEQLVAQGKRFKTLT